MLTYQLNGKNKYYSLYCHIRSDILSGNLSAGEKLPSKRALAQNLSVSVITVQTAYEQLLAEGYIVSRERSGYFVADVAGHAGTLPQGAVEREEGKPGYEYDLVSGSPPAGLFPFSVWAKCMRTVLSDEGEHLLERVPCRGDSSLRRQIAGYLYRMRGVAVDPSCIVVGAGAEYLYGIIVQLVGRDKLFAAENPGYGKIYSSYNISGAKCCFFNVSPADQIAGNIQKLGAHVVHLSPSHQFPTGQVLPVSQRLKIISCARQSGGYIVEDDYDSEFRLSGKPLQSMLELCPDRVIYINTFSKCLAPSMRMGYMVLPQELMQRFLSLFGPSANVVPLFEQKALAAMIGGGHFERHINRLRNYYRAVRREVVEAIASLPFSSTINDTGSGLHLTVSFNNAPSDEYIKSACLQRGINVRCLSDYFLAPAAGYEKTVVVNYGGLKKGQAARIASKFLR